MNSSVPPDRPPSVSWEIASDTQADAYDSYRESFGDLYEVSDVADDGRSGFRSQTRAHLFGASVLGRGRSVAQTLGRDAAQVRTSGLDHISVIVNMADTVGDCDGRDLRAAAGAVQFRDLARPSISHTANIDVLNIMIPRTSVPGWLMARGVHGLVLPAASAGGRLMASHLMTVAEVADDLTEEQGVAAIEAAFVIAERFLGHERVAAPAHTDSIQKTIRQRAMALLDARGAKTAWSADTLAREVGVSRTSLYRAFEVTGGIRAYVQARRLARAYAALRARRANRPSVEEIGQVHGFADRPTFVAAFRARFGMTPDEVTPSDAVRRAADAGPATAIATGRAMHDVIMDWLHVGEAI